MQSEDNILLILVATFQLHHVQQLLFLLKHHLFHHNFVSAGEIMQTLVHASDVVPDTCRNVCKIVCVHMHSVI